MKTFSIKALLISLGLVFSANGMAAQYTIDGAQSKVHWKGTKVGGAHDGTVAVQSGKLTYEEGTLKSFEVTVDMNKMTNADLSGEWRDKLLAHLKNDDFFAVDKYPTSKIKSTKVDSLGNNRYKVTADLTIKDKTQPVVFEATVAPEGNDVKGSTKFKFDRAKYDIRYNSGSFFKDLGDKLIHDEVELTVDVVAKQ